MEEDGFGPSKLKSNRFTVCPLWPLGNSSILVLLLIRCRYPVLLSEKMELVDGLEPPTC